MKHHTGPRTLKKFFNVMNRRFFNGELPADVTIKFSEMEEDGLCTHADKLIEINEDFQNHPDICVLILTHEMAHLKVGEEYVGMPSNADHGMRFQAEIVRLFQAGAYDGIL